jgi:hypothetical protein
VGLVRGRFPAKRRRFLFGLSVLGNSSKARPRATLLLQTRSFGVLPVAETSFYIHSLAIHE